MLWCFTISFNYYQTLWRWNYYPHFKMIKRSVSKDSIKCLGLHWQKMAEPRFKSWWTTVQRMMFFPVFHNFLRKTISQVFLTNDTSDLTAFLEYSPSQNPTMSTTTIFGFLLANYGVFSCRFNDSIKHITKIMMSTYYILMTL